MNIVGIIPARMASSRLPGKPMASIQGMAMIEHVYKRSLKCPMLSSVYIATCDEEIANHIKEIGGEAIMTDIAHERASDRTAEAMLQIERNKGEKIDIVVMIQGDEPMITPNMIEKAIKPLLLDSSVNIVNLMGRINTIDEFNDPAEVKVIVDKNNDAIYFSREPIPSVKKTSEKVPMLKQICTIPFRRDYLLHYNNLAPTKLEILESIDMNRLIENGEKIRMVWTEEETYSVDTQEDLVRVNAKMAKDPIFKRGY